MCGSGHCTGIVRERPGEKSRLGTRRIVECRHQHVRTERRASGDPHRDPEGLRFATMTHGLSCCQITTMHSHRASFRPFRVPVRRGLVSLMNLLQEFTLLSPFQVFQTLAVGAVHPGPVLEVLARNLDHPNVGV